jgi:hypothetical protein
MNQSKLLPKYLIQVFGKSPTKFSIRPQLGQSRKDLCKEVDQIVGHENYGAENYVQTIFTRGCFGGFHS